MKSEFTPGKSSEITIQVTHKMRAAFNGRVIHNVYSTFAMVEHMEEAARKLLEPHLEPGEEGIGYKICVTHLAPAPVGSRVRVRAKLLRIVGNQVVARVEAFHGKTKIGEGIQVQVVMPRKKLEARLRKTSPPRGSRDSKKTRVKRSF